MCGGLMFSSRCGSLFWPSVGTVTRMMATRPAGRNSWRTFMAGSPKQVGVVGRQLAWKYSAARRASDAESGKAVSALAYHASAQDYTRSFTFRSTFFTVPAYLSPSGYYHLGVR